MGYENLMGKAEEIRKRAVEEAIKDFAKGSKAAGLNIINEGPKIEAEFADIPALFEPFAMMPDPSSFDGPIGKLMEALKVLSIGEPGNDGISARGYYDANVKLAGMAGAASDVAGWSGNAAAEFKSNFLDPFPMVVRNQFWMVAMLKSALEAEQAMWSEARKNIWDIAEKTYDLLGEMDDCGQNDWTMTFTVVASICAIAVVPMTGGASLGAFTVIAVGATAQVVGAAQIEEAPKQEIRGETVRVLIASMRSAISKQHQVIDETERRIRDTLSRLNDRICENRDYFVANRPALADATSKNIRRDEYMGYTD